MTMHVKQSGAWVTAKSMHVKQSGAWVAVKQGWVKQGGGWKQYFTSLGLSISPALVSGGHASPNGNGTATTGTATAAVQGGTGPFTYAWALVSSTAHTVLSPGAAATAFQKGSPGGDPTYSATYRCTVTDATGATASATVDVQTTFTATDPR